MEALKAIGAFVVLIVVIAAIILGGWLAGWWFKQQNVEKESDVFRDSYANQERLREDALDKISSVQSLEVKVSELSASEEVLKAQLEAQGVSIIRIACNDIHQINDPEPMLEEFSAIHC